MSKLPYTLSNALIEISFILDEENVTNIKLNLSQTNKESLDKLCEEISEKYSLKNEVKEKLYEYIIDQINEIRAQIERKYEIERIKKNSKLFPKNDYVVNRLYYQGTKIKKERELSNEKKKQSQLEEELKNYSFTPKINSSTNLFRYQKNLVDETNNEPADISNNQNLRSVNNAKNQSSKEILFNENSMSCRNNSNLRSVKRSSSKSKDIDYMQDGYHSNKNNNNIDYYYNLNHLLNSSKSQKDYSSTKNQGNDAFRVKTPNKLLRSSSQNSKTAKKESDLPLNLNNHKDSHIKRIIMNNKNYRKTSPNPRYLSSNQINQFSKSSPIHELIKENEKENILTGNINKTGMPSKNNLEINNNLMENKTQNNQVRANLRSFNKKNTKEEAKNTSKPENIKSNKYLLNNQSNKMNLFYESPNNKATNNIIISSEKWFERLYNAQQLQKYKQERLVNSYMREQCPFEPKLCKGSYELTKDRNESQNQLYKRLYSNPKGKKKNKKVETLNDENNNELRQQFYNDGPYYKNESYRCSNRTPYLNKRTVKEIKSDNEINEQLEELKNEKNEGKKVAKDSINTNFEKFKKNQFKDIFEILKDNAMDYSSLAKAEVPKHIIQRVVKPTCRMINEKDLEFNFHNFYTIAVELLNHFCGGGKLAE